MMARASVSRADNLSLFTLRWWEKVLVVCFSQITFRLMSLSRTDPGSGLAYLRQTFVLRSQGPGGPAGQTERYQQPSQGLSQSVGVPSATSGRSSLASPLGGLALG